MTREHAMVSASKRAGRLLVIALTVLLPLAAQSGSSRRPLKLRLIVPGPQVCLRAGKLEMEVVFSNDGESPISIYPSSIYDFWFTKTIIKGKQSKVESHEIRKDVGTGDPALHESPVVLQSRSSVVVPLGYDISDSFFGESATYSVRVAYMKLGTSATPVEAVVGDSESNEVLFQMSECH